MIFATVGTQLPFPRFISALDRIAEKTGLEIYAQTADPTTVAKHIQHVPHLHPGEFSTRSNSARLLVGHAGIGTLITAKRLKKPFVIYPRHASLGEHRNDHQLATARTLAGVEGIYIAWDDEELERLLTSESLVAPTSEHGERRERLIQRLRSFILASPHD